MRDLRGSHRARIQVQTFANNVIDSSRTIRKPAMATANHICSEGDIALPYLDFVPRFGPCKGHECDLCRICRMGRCCGEPLVSSPKSPRGLSLNPRHTLGSLRRVASNSPHVIGDSQIRFELVCGQGQRRASQRCCGRQGLDSLGTGTNVRGGLGNRLSRPCLRIPTCRRGAPARREWLLWFLSTTSSLTGWRPSAAKHGGRHPSYRSRPIPTQRFALGAQA